MSDERIREKAAGWDDNSNVIIAYRNPIGSANCELCASRIAALPASITASRRPGWHLICRECFAVIIPIHKAEIHGRFSDEATARKVLNAKEP